MIKNERGEVIANINRTIFATTLQVTQSRKAPYQYMANTTLNEKFDILPGTYPAPNDYPSVDFWVMGRGGHRNYVGGDGADLSEPHYHEPNHAALYEHLPFVLRPQDNDLTTEERAKYGLRRLEEHNGTTYVAYYAKRLAPVENAIGILHVTVENGTETVSDFVPSASDLSPTPPTTSGSGVVDLTGEYLTTSESIKVELTKQEIDEVINACLIKYGNTAYASISEIGLVHGKDKVSAASDHLGNPFNYTEIIGAQMNTMYCSEPDSLRSSENFSVVFDMGVSDALGITE